MQIHVASRQQAKSLVAWRLLTVDEVTSLHLDFQHRQRQPTPTVAPRKFEGQYSVIFKRSSLLWYLKTRFRRTC